MIKRGKSGNAQFVLTPAKKSKSVALAGSFTNWKPVTMKPQKDGSYATTVKLPAGKHEYKFIVDGQWVTDPDNNAFAANPYGTVNSTVQVSPD